MKRKAGDVLGDYVLTERAGGGPASELWKAVHRDDPSRRAAVRFFVGGRGLPPLRVKSDLLCSLDHPNIARVDEVDMAAEEPYLRREWVEGGSLAEKGLPKELWRDVAVKVLRALAFAHARGVTHGGLGASDVLIGAEGRVKVSDFGLEGTGTDPAQDLRALGELLLASGIDRDGIASRLVAGGFDSAGEALAALESVKTTAVGRTRMPSWVAGPVLIVGVFFIAYVGIGMTFMGLQPSLRLIAAAAGAGLCAAAWRHIERPLAAAVFWGALLWGFGARIQGPAFMAGAWAVALAAGGLWWKGRPRI